MRLRSHDIALLFQLLFQALNVQLPDNVANKKHNAKDTKEAGKKHIPDHEKTTSGAPANAGPYHYEQGLKSKSLPQIAGHTGGALKSLWDDVLLGPVEAVKTEVGAVSKTIMETFAKNKEITVGNILNLIGASVIDLVMNFIRAFIKALMKLGEGLIIGLRNAIDTPVEFPVISALLRKIGIKTFSLLDVVALVIAFPVTIACKLVTGDAPKPITIFDYKVRIQCFW